LHAGAISRRIRRPRPTIDGWAVLKGLSSLQARLSFISILLFFLIVGFGVFALQMFNGVSQLTDDLRQRWLPSTRLLGDLNNVTSDYRAAEGDCLLALDDTDRAARLAVVAKLSQDVAHAELSYKHIFHTPEELAQYGRFSSGWTAYKRQADRVFALAKTGQAAAAVTLYRRDSRTAYNAASDALGLLTAQTVDGARAASARTESAFLQARWLIIGALILAGALLAASLAYIRGWISNPLVDMARTMRELAESKLDIDVAGLERRDEIGEMARAVTVFRAHAVELLQSQQGLAQQAAMLQQKLAYEQQLTRLQRNFVVMVSHEFRTPLTIIDAHAQRLINMCDHVTTAELIDRAGRMRAAVQRITNLMDNLLTSARLIDGEAKLFFHPEPMDLTDLLHEVCTFHRETAPHADIDEDFLKATMPIVGDRKLLFQSFSNLLSNAIKYSRDEINIKVTARSEARRIIIAIKDNGLGIPPQDVANLFERYYRGKNVSGIVGTGVGLYLVKTVVDLHGGEIAVQSKEGDGACFTISLPDHAASDAAAAT
jgi:signal transduction histidine kinase